MKKKLLLFLTSTILFCGCTEFSKDYFSTVFFIAVCFGIATLVAKHFDWGVGDYVSDNPPGCAVIAFIVALVIGAILYFVGSYYNGSLL